MNRIGNAFAAFALASAFSFLAAADAETQQPIVRKVVGIHLRERGALLMEDFKGDTIDEKKWRKFLSALFS